MKCTCVAHHAYAVLLLMYSDWQLDTNYYIAGLRDKVAAVVIAETFYFYCLLVSRSTVVQFGKKSIILSVI